MAFFIIMNLVAFILGIYYIFLQYYVLLVEIIVFAILLIIDGLEIILGFFACWQFQSYEKQQWFSYSSYTNHLFGYHHHFSLGNIELSFFLRGVSSTSKTPLLSPKV